MHQVQIEAYGGDQARSNYPKEMRAGGIMPPHSPPTYFPVDDNVNVTLLLGVASRALMLRMEREKLNNLERK